MGPRAKWVSETKWRAERGERKASATNRRTVMRAMNKHAAWACHRIWVPWQNVGVGWDGCRPGLRATRQWTLLPCWLGVVRFFLKKNGRVCGCSFGQAERWWNSWNSWSLRCSFCFIYPAETCLLTFFFFFWAGSIFVDESKGNSDTSLAEIRAITILNSRLLYVFEFKHFYAGRSLFPETMLINFEFVHAFELCKKFPL